jgi:TolA-binding protein
MTILILTLLGAAVSVGFSCFQVNRQEQAQAQTQMEIRRLQDMQQQTIEQQRRMMQNQAAARAKAVQVHPVATPVVLKPAQPAARRAATPARTATPAKKQPAKAAAPAKAGSGTRKKPQTGTVELP